MNEVIKQIHYGEKEGTSISLKLLKLHFQKKKILWYLHALNFRKRRSDSFQ